MSRFTTPSITLSSVAFAALLTACGEEGGMIIPPPEYVQTFGDEFDGAANESPDPSKWTFDVGGDGWGNNQLEFDTDRPENASLDGEGNLRIIARREAFMGREYTSARMKTQGLFAQKYGRFEARMKLARGQGIWPAFWMLGANFPEVGWPDCGEIDIMEFRGQEPDVVVGSLHGPGYSGGQPITRRFRDPEGGNLAEEFHTYSVDWDPSRIVWRLDGEVYQTVTSGDVLNRGRWAFDNPFFILLNLAVGGSYVGDPDASTPFPAEILVDYVRVFQRTSF